MKDNKIVCGDCRENRFSKGMKKLYPKKIKCPYCKKEIGYRRLTKKEKEDA